MFYMKLITVGYMPLFRRTAIPTYRYSDKYVPLFRQKCTDIPTCRNIGLSEYRYGPIFRQ